MQREGISEFEAYNRLQQRARTERRTLLEAAEEEIRDLAISLKDRYVPIPHSNTAGAGAL